MPLSWVPALAVSRERLDSRCPRVQYRQARRELYARFGECTRWDGLVSLLAAHLPRRLRLVLLHCMPCPALVWSGRTEVRWQ